MAISIIKSTLWSFLQRGGSLIISFVSSIVLARLLCPEDFGTMAMIMVFVGIADVLVDGGLGNALIQKKEINKNDINTVFTVNIAFSAILYLLIFISAPYIASFTTLPSLVLYLRIQAISVIIRATFTVHFSLLNRNMKFKNLAIIGLVTNTISTLVAIALAFMNWGVWSLILKTLLVDVMSGIMYYYYCNEHVHLDFRLESFKYMFNYGIFVVSANILENIYSNILSFFIGKQYTIKDLGYYNQAHALYQIPVFSISAVVNQVFFPYFSKMQDGVDNMRTHFQTIMIVVTFFVYALLSYLIFFAKPIIMLIYSEKWLPSVPLFQVLCLSGFFNAILHLSRSTIKALGRSKILFYSQLATTITGVCIIFFFMNFDIRIFVYVAVINTLIAYSIAGHFVGKFIHFNLWEQFRNIAPNMAIALISSLLAYFVIKITRVNSTIILLGISFIINIACYVSLHYLFKTTPMTIILDVVKDKLSRK